MQQNSLDCAPSKQAKQTLSTFSRLNSRSLHSEAGGGGGATGASVVEGGNAIPSGPTPTGIPSLLKGLKIGRRQHRAKAEEKIGVSTCFPALMTPVNIAAATVLLQTLNAIVSPLVQRTPPRAQVLSEQSGSVSKNEQDLMPPTTFVVFSWSSKYVDVPLHLCSAFSYPTTSRIVVQYCKIKRIYECEHQTKSIQS